MLAEISTKSISESSNPKTLKEHEVVAKRGGNVALPTQTERATIITRQLI